MAYTTQQGDTWDLIAWRVYRNEGLFNVLVDANPAYQNTVVFDQGISIVTPVVTAVSPPPFPLPPWASGYSITSG